MKVPSVTTQQELKASQKEGWDDLKVKTHQYASSRMIFLRGSKQTFVGFPNSVHNSV